MEYLRDAEGVKVWIHERTVVEANDDITLPCAKTEERLGMNFEY
jgi:hypothetical protein